MCARASAGFVAVQGPVTVHALDPDRLVVGVLGRGDEREPTDGSLPTLVVAVEQEDGDHLAATDRFRHLLLFTLVAFVAVAERPLPEAAVAGGDVEVAALGPEVVEVGMCLQLLCTPTLVQLEPAEVELVT